MDKYVRIWFFLLFPKIAVATFIPLFSDEAYYWVWSKNLQLSYYDHPGMIAWLFYLGHKLDGFFQACRIPAVLIGHLSIWFWFDLLRDHISEKHYKLLIIGLSLIPLSGMGLLIMTPDLPLLLFWSVSLWAFIKALNTKNISWYLLLGISLGLGACSKYHIVLFPLTAIFYILIEKKLSQVLWKCVALSIIVAVLTSWPVWYWNYQNDFISFRYQLHHGFGQVNSFPLGPLRYLLDQLLLIFPPIAFLAFRKGLPKEISWLRHFACVPLIFFFLTSFQSPVEANWPSVGHPAVFALAFILSKDQFNWIRITVASWLVIFLILVSHLAFQWIPHARNLKKLDELNQYKEVLAAKKEPLPIYTSTYQMASLLYFYTKIPHFKLRGVGRKDFFDYLPESQPKLEKFYWLSNLITPLPDWLKTEDYIIESETPVNAQWSLFVVRKP